MRNQNELVAPIGKRWKWRVTLCKKVLRNRVWMSTFPACHGTGRVKENVWCLVVFSQLQDSSFQSLPKKQTHLQTRLIKSIRWSAHIIWKLLFYISIYRSPPFEFIVYWITFLGIEMGDSLLWMGILLSMKMERAPQKGITLWTSIRTKMTLLKRWSNR